MINVSETAASKINELLTEENKAGSGLRVFVQGGGCSGFQYGLMIEENGQGARKTGRAPATRSTSRTA
jgi:Fe-S cluster assembly iron-binding protein IscA